MHIQNNKGSNALMICLLTAVVGGIALSTALVLSKFYSASNAANKAKNAGLQSSQFGLLLTSMRFQIKGNALPVWYPDTYPTQEELKTSQNKPLIQVLSPLKSTENAMTLISEKIATAGQSAIRNYDLDLTNMGAILNVADSKLLIKEGKSQSAYISMGDMSALTTDNLNNLFLMPTASWPRSGTKLTNLENAKIYFDSYDTETLPDKSLFIKGVKVTVERGSTRNNAVFAIDAPPTPQCKISLPTAPVPAPSFDCTSSQAVLSNTTEYFTWTDMEHGAATYKRYVAIKALFPTWDPYGRAGGATSGVAFYGDDDTHLAMCNFMGYQSRYGTRITNSWRSPGDNGAMRFYPATKQFKQVPARTNNLHTNGYYCIGKLVQKCYDDPTWIAKLPPPPPPPPKPYKPGDSVTFNFTTTSITQSATIENKKSGVDFTIAPQSIRNLGKDTPVSTTGTITLTIPGEASLTGSNPDGTKNWVVTGSVVGVDSRQPASTCSAQAIKVVTAPDCNSPTAIVSNETTPVMATSRGGPVSLRYEELRRAGILPAGSPAYYNLWYPGGDGVDLYGDADSIKKSCNLLGYANGAPREIHPYRSPGDNGVMKWNPSRKTFDLFNARSNNLAAFTITCTGKLESRCYSNPAWIFK